MDIVDFHVHAFPDAIAARAVPALEAEGNVKAALDGRVDSLLASMDRAGIATSVVCSIATKPSQFETILEWSKSIASPRLVPLLSVHPADPRAAERIGITRAEGFAGLKLHPYYQDFRLDEERLFPLYERMIEENLLAVTHTGYDMAYPRDDRCAPPAVAAVLDRFPELKLVTTHCGGWMDWERVRTLLVGRPVAMDISYALGQMDGETARDILDRHPADQLLFGSDSPWEDPADTLARVRALGLPDDRLRRLLGANARALLASVAVI